MKQIIERMVKLTIAKWHKNNIHSKKSISGLFTTLCLLAILAANSAFISEGIGQTLEITKRVLLEALPIGEEITAVKISTPSRSMIRAADREIHLNMNTMIKELNSLHISIVDPNTADHDINEQFIQENMSNTGWEKIENADMTLTKQFEAENINMNLDDKFLYADKQMVNQFYLNNYNISNPSCITVADEWITDIFYAENI